MTNRLNLPLTIMLISLPASSALAQGATSPSAMQRSHEMRREVIMAGDARQLSTISHSSRTIESQPRIITAPAFRPPTSTVRNSNHREPVTFTMSSPSIRPTTASNISTIDQHNDLPGAGAGAGAGISLASPRTIETATTSYHSQPTYYDNNYSNNLDINPVTRVGYRHVETYDDGWSSYRHVSHSSAFVTGHGGYFHTSRRYYHHYHRPTVIISHGYPVCYTRPVVYPRVIYYHRPCPPPAVVVCPPRHSGFSFFVKF